MLLAPAPGAAHSANIVATSILYSPMAVRRCELLRAQAQPVSITRRLTQEFVSGNGPGCGSHPAQAAGWLCDGGHAYRPRDRKLHARARIRSPDPTAAYFLFDRAFPRRSKSEDSRFNPRSLHPAAERMPAYDKKCAAYCVSRTGTGSKWTGRWTTVGREA